MFVKLKDKNEMYEKVVNTALIGCIERAEGDCRIVRIANCGSIVITKEQYTQLCEKVMLGD